MTGKSSNQLQPASVGGGGGQEAGGVTKLTKGASNDVIRGYYIPL